ncbi:endonuclease [Paraglaciecola aestuariivivens]
MKSNSKGARFAGVISTLAALSVWSTSALAAVPANYYDSVDTSTAQALHNSLHEIIDDHQRFPYTSTSTDTWDVLELADQDPNNPNNVIDIYKNASYPKQGGGNTFYNREHSWPKSYGFPNDGSSNYPYTDMHHLFISDSGYNSSRSNKPYADCGVGCSEKITESNNGRGGSASESNWTEGSFTQGSWQTWSGRKGDVARALMYMAVRYEGGMHGVTSVTEPDLVLTDDRTLIENSNTGSNGLVAYMGLRSVLIQWHKDDPVDAFEIQHNDTVYAYQGNRNPFVDHPEYVACVFEQICSGGGDTTPPTSPSNLSATGETAQISLNWSANTESDLQGYNLYRSETSGGNYTKVNSSVINTNSFVDSGLTANTSYYYVVAAIDTSNNESGFSAQASATTLDSGTPATAVWINEFHYDNDSTDVGEFVEVAGNANTDLTGWSLVAYNGNGGTVYKTVNLAGVITNQQNGLGTLAFDFSGLQNGAPDGIALIDASNNVVDFISYEGVMTATDGAAAGLTSTNVGVSETSNTPVGYSLQLSGSGQQASDFTWQAAGVNTKGQFNTNQSISGGGTPANQAPNASFVFNCTDLTCTFTDTSTDSDGSIASASWALGDGSTASGSSVQHSYSTDGTYSVVLTVTDNQGATSQFSDSISVSAPVNQPSYFENTTAIFIPDRSTITSDINVNRTGAANSVSVAVNISHSFRGDISVTLIAPDGSSYLLKSQSKKDGGQNIVETYQANVSGNAQGVWSLSVRDHYRRDTGQLNNWSIQF